VDAEPFALARRVLLIRASHKVGLDVAPGGLPFEESVVQRLSRFVYPPHIPLRTCSAEDLVVMKSFAGPGQDWVNVERILVRQAEKLDWGCLQSQLRPLAELKGEPEILSRLDRLCEESGK
jgi:hypothetical protein